MKSIFLPIDDPEVCRPMFEVALAYARRFGSHIESGATVPVLDNYIVGEMVPLWPPQQRSMGDIAREAHDVFQSAMMRAGLSPESASSDGGPSFGWYESPLLGDGAVAARARVFDATVVGRPTASGSGPRLSLLETIVFESGRPLLIAPPDAQPETIGDSVVIAWNCSTETARTTALAMPMLQRAKRVQVLTVEGGTVPGPSGADMARMLRLNGIPAEELTVSDKGRTSGEAILTHAEGFGADLLIKGAYTQSRLRQMIFGGATSHVLAHARIPVFMAH
ncbi:universal stress protein [uncultured Alsobacter sp.]|uniref:universal stress protein n=1 Tax=uncultured Alsobacter sp. TaxID=1748258 RepID=UPI0025E7185A|nr:universal stress protein [uncultured Alsobacter sp.]